MKFLYSKNRKLLILLFIRFECSFRAVFPTNGFFFCFSYNLFVVSGRTIFLTFEFSGCRQHDISERIKEVLQMQFM